MQDFTTHLRLINEKLQQFVKRYNNLQKEHLQLKKDLDKCRLELAEKREQINALQQKVDVLKLGPHNWNEEEKKILEKRIDVYLREIEKCLQLLHS